MSSAPLSDRLTQAAHALMSALGDHRRGLPRWAVTYLHAAIDRLRKGAVDLLRKLEAGTYRPRKPGAGRTTPTHTRTAPRAPRPAPAIRFPNYPNILSELIGNQRPVYGPDLRDLMQDPALPGYVQTCPTLARRLRPLCRLVGIAIPDWLRPPPRPRAKPAPGARAKRLPPDPSKPSWLLLRAACRADSVLRTWTGSGSPPEVLVHTMRHLLSKEVIDLLKPQFKFLNAMFP